jgi:hypothetical protein
MEVFAKMYFYDVLWGTDDFLLLQAIVSNTCSKLWGTYASPAMRIRISLKFYIVQWVLQEGEWIDQGILWIGKS